MRVPPASTTLLKLLSAIVNFSDSDTHYHTPHWCLPSLVGGQHGPLISWTLIPADGIYLIMVLSQEGHQVSKCGAEHIIDSQEWRSFRHITARHTNPHYPQPMVRRARVLHPGQALPSQYGRRSSPPTYPTVSQMMQHHVDISGFVPAATNMTWGTRFTSTSLDVTTEIVLAPALATTSTTKRRSIPMLRPAMASPILL